MRKIRWGVLSTALIGTEKVIPAMQRGEHTSVSAIASRDLEKARRSAGVVDLVDNPPGPLCRPAGQGDHRPPISEFPGGCLADPGTGAGDQNVFFGDIPRAQQLPFSP